MNTSELRIGNWISGGNDPFMQVTGIYKTHITANFPDAESDDWEYDIDKVNGWALTPEILEKAGFVCDDTHYKREDFTYIHKKDFSMWMMPTWSMYGNHVKLKYVHELQNLFFALKGKELEISL